MDAELLLDLLVHHRVRLRRLNPDTAQTRLVQHLVEGRRKLVNEKTRQSNRLTAQLKLYFPQILDWFDKIESPVVADLLKRWPSLEVLQSARSATVRSFFTQHNCRSLELIEQRLEAIRQALPAVRDQALIEAATAMTKVLVELIATLREGIAYFYRPIAQAAAPTPILPSLILSLVPGRRWLRVCWQPSARKGPATRAPRTCRRSPESLPLPNVAGSPNGFAFVGPVRAFCARLATSGPLTRSASAPGPPLTTVCSGIAERIITLVSGHWLSNGSASPFVAGKTALSMTTPAMSRVCAVVAHH